MKRRTEEDIEFEIEFYEGILKKRGDFTEALMALGDLYTKKGLFKKGLVIDQKLAKLKPDDSIVLYNLACSYSLVEDIDNALSAIKKSLECGYDDFAYMEEDSDLDNLRKDARFIKYFSKYKKKQDT